MWDRSDIEEAEARIRAGWHVKSLPEKAFCNDNVPLNTTAERICDYLRMTNEQKKQAPRWLGWESGQRKRYLKSLEQDLASELGPNWREKVANSSGN